jgi:hypothetical protein
MRELHIPQQYLHKTEGTGKSTQTFEFNTEFRKKTE